MLLHLEIYNAQGQGNVADFIIYLAERNSI